MFPRSVLVFTILTIAAALPTAREVSTDDACAVFLGGFSNAGNFTLAALNTTLPNANTTGAPIVLGQAGAIDGAEFEVLSTWASFPFNDWPTLSLKDHGLTANRDPPSPSAPTVSGGATNGSEITFITTSLNPPVPAPVYCGVANTDPAGGGSRFPQLAVNGHTDLFSLCLAGTQNNIVYNATENNFGAYNFSSCYPVALNMLGLD